MERKRRESHGFCECCVQRMLLNFLLSHLTTFGSRLVLRCDSNSGMYMNVMHAK